MGLSDLMDVKMWRYIRNYEYYCEAFAKRIGGRGNMNPRTNGEFRLLERIVEFAGDEITFIDGGANLGEHSEEFLKLCSKHNKKPRLISVEPFPATAEALSSNLKGKPHTILTLALGDDSKSIKFYYDNNAGETSGSNSVFRHYYLNSGETYVRQETLDVIASQQGISSIDFLKLDVEGSELNALNGAVGLLEDKKIKYVQLEYNQTWLKGGGSIGAVFDMCQKLGYRLFRLSKSGLISMPSYHYMLDDFVFCNLLLICDGEKLPLPSIKKALPFI
jgi:FkbM family methyltransferase